MTEPKDPNHPREAPGGIDATSASSAWRPGFTSSRPPSAAGEWTLASLVRAFAHCEHPKEGHSPATVLEPDGSHVEIRWCGACGAMDLNGRAFGDWIRPGLAQVLGDGDRLSALARDIGVRVDRMAELVKGARAARSRVGDASEAKRGELPAVVRELEGACEELAGFVRGVLGEWTR